jgi:hypothetical protein
MVLAATPVAERVPASDLEHWKVLHISGAMEVIANLQVLE